MGCGIVAGWWSYPSDSAAVYGVEKYDWMNAMDPNSYWCNIGYRCAGHVCRR